jgi:hypothetical protein
VGSERLQFLGVWVGLTLLALAIGVLWRVIVPRKVGDVNIAILAGVTLGAVVILPTQAGRDWGWVLGGILLPWGALCGWFAAKYISNRR